jgi:hydroxyethylthiazole kinase-like sugar kinase family protein
MRCEFVFELLENKSISIIKGNSSEIEALLGDMTREQFAVKYSVTVVETGKISTVNDGSHFFEVEMPMGRLQELPATGCALGTVMAGFMIKGADAYQSAVRALEIMSKIGGKMDTTCPYGRLKETFLNEMEVCIYESLLCDK